MALTKEKKAEVIKDVARLVQDSKMTVAAKYTGTSVKAIQALRKSGTENGTVIKVVKNRLVKKAFEQVETFKESDTSALKDMLLYAFNSEDEVAPAQTLSKFMKANPTLEFVGAFNGEGQFLPADDVKALADLPTKEQLRGMLVGTISAPLSGFVNVVNGNLRGFLTVLNARSESIE